MVKYGASGPYLPLPEEKRKSLGRPFYRRPLASDWLFWWTLVLAGLTAFTTAQGYPDFALNDFPLSAFAIDWGLRFGFYWLFLVGIPGWWRRQRGPRDRPIQPAQDSSRLGPEKAEEPGGPTPHGGREAQLKGATPKFKIIYRPKTGQDDEEVEADSFQDQEQWIDFYASDASGGSSRVLRVRAEHVVRIEQIQD